MNTNKIKPFLPEGRNQESRIKNLDGFTLLELLVVIGIIGMLISIAAVSYSSAQGRTRDARRKSDIKGIQVAMEQYYSQQPTSIYAVCSTGVKIVNGNCAIGSYFSGGSVPVDPGTNDYTFTASSTTAYRVCATLDDNVTQYCLTQLQ